MKNTASKKKTPVAKIDLVSGLVAGCITGLAGGAAVGCEGVEILMALGAAIGVCLLISIIKPYKPITKKLFSNERFEIDEDDHKGRIITAAAASLFCSVIIAVAFPSAVITARTITIDNIVDAYDVQIASVQEQIDVLTADNEKLYQDFCLVSDLVDKNKEEIEGYNSRIRELEAQKKGFEDEIITYNAEINVINKDLDEKKNDEGDWVENWRKEKNAKIDELNSQIQATTDGITEVDTNSAAMEEKWNIYSEKLIGIQSLQNNADNLSSEQLRYYYSKPTFEGLFGKTLIACFIAGLAAFAGVVYLREPVTEKLEEIKASREEALKKQEEEKAEAERKAREADEAVISELKERRQQHLMSQNDSDDTSGEV